MVICFCAGRYIIGPLLRAPEKQEASVVLDSPIPKAEAPETQSATIPARPIATAVELPTPKKPTATTTVPEPRLAEDDASRMETETTQVLLPSTSVSAKTETTAPEPTPHSSLYTVQAGVFSTKDAAAKIVEKLRNSKLNAEIFQEGREDRILYFVRVGSFRSRDNAERLAEDVKAAGVDAYIASEP